VRMLEEGTYEGLPGLGRMVEDGDVARDTPSRDSRAAVRAATLSKAARISLLI